MAGSIHSNGGAAAAFHGGPSNGAGAGRQSSSTSGLAPAAQPGVQPGFDAGVDHHFAAKVPSSWAMLLPGFVSRHPQRSLHGTVSSSMPPTQFQAAVLRPVLLSKRRAPALQVDKALQNISSRVDELALQPQVYTARLEQELSALATAQQALQVAAPPSRTTPRQLSVHLQVDCPTRARTADVLGCHNRSAQST